MAKLIELVVFAVVHGKIFNAKDVVINYFWNGRFHGNEVKKQNYSRSNGRVTCEKCLAPNVRKDVLGEISNQCFKYPHQAFAFFFV